MSPSHKEYVFDCSDLNLLSALCLKCRFETGPRRLARGGGG